MPDPILQDLHKVPDDALFTRLAMLRQRLPVDTSAEDYLYRYETWTMANQAVHAEIRRRKVAAPRWWAAAVEREQVRRPRTGLIVLYLATMAAAIIVFGVHALAFAIMLTVLVCGLIWLVSVIRENQGR